MTSFMNSLLAEKGKKQSVACSNNAELCALFAQKRKVCLNFLTVNIKEHTTTTARQQFETHRCRHLFFWLLGAEHILRNYRRGEGTSQKTTIACC